MKLWRVEWYEPGGRQRFAWHTSRVRAHQQANVLPRGVGVSITRIEIDVHTRAGMAVWLNHNLAMPSR